MSAAGSEVRQSDAAVSVIAIDGPGGSGKSTLARLLAERLGVERLDTGAMYRAVTLAALGREVPLEDGEALGRLAESLRLELGERVLVDGVDVTEAIRSDEVNAAVSVVAAHKEVREALVAAQRSWVAARPAAVVEGRDIGSVVLPDADLKVYLTASAEERAARRAQERGDEADLAVVHASIAARDRIDSTRTHSPLEVSSGALVIDSTGRSAESVLAEILERIGR